MATAKFQVLYGAATAASAEVYVRWCGEGAAPAAQFHWKGPYCELARTLPTQANFRQLQPNLWQAQIVDPCFWSAEFPARYELRASSETETIVSIPAEFAIRHLGVVRDHLRFDRRRWVWRATDLGRLDGQGVSIAQLAADCREHGLSVIVAEVDAEFGWAASRHGLLLTYRIAAGSPELIVSTLAQIAEWPATAMAILPAGLSVDRESLQRAAPNLLWIADLTDRDLSLVPEWSDLLLVDPQPARIASLRQMMPTQPIVAQRVSATRQTIAAARRACEVLQQQLAPALDLAGYVS